jgi:hypothetical protein
MASPIRGFMILVPDGASIKYVIEHLRAEDTASAIKYANVLGFDAKLRLIASQLTPCLDMTVQALNSDPKSIVMLVMSQLKRVKGYL